MGDQQRPGETTGDPLLVSLGLQWSPGVSAGLHWSPVVSHGLSWSPVVSLGLQGSLLVSFGLQRYLVVFIGLYWSPLVPVHGSNGLLGSRLGCNVYPCYPYTYIVFQYMYDTDRCVLFQDPLGTHKSKANVHAPNLLKGVCANSQ